MSDPSTALFFGGAAVFSPCEHYRYRLERDLGGLRVVCFLMLNPSTATAETNDPTIRRCIGYTRDWDYGRLIVVNLFAWRATDPRALQGLADPVGPDNDQHIRRAVAEAELVVAAWGRERWRFVQTRAIKVIFDVVGEARLHCISTTNRGEPSHPLMLKQALRPQPYWMGRCLS